MGLSGLVLVCVLGAGEAVSPGEESRSLPVLIDPAACDEVAAATTVPTLTRVETAILCGRLDLAREWLGAYQAPPELQARKLRLEVDAALTEGDASPASIGALRDQEGWQAHVRHVRRRKANWSDRMAHLSSILAAVALAFLLLYGSRELLRIHPASLRFAAAAIPASVLVSWSSPSLGYATLLGATATFTLVHATAAAVARLRPGPRWRLLLLTLLFLGTVGAWGAVLGRFGPVRAFAQLFG